MPEDQRRLSLRIGDFAIAAEGFDDPARPIRMLVRTVQQALEETPDFARTSFAIEEDVVNNLLANLSRQDTDGEFEFEAVPGIVLIRHDRTAATGTAPAAADESAGDVSPTAASDVPETEVPDRPEREAPGLAAAAAALAVPAAGLAASQLMSDDTPVAEAHAETDPLPEPALREETAPEARAEPDPGQTDRLQADIGQEDPPSEPEAEIPATEMQAPPLPRIFGRHEIPDPQSVNPGSRVPDSGDLLREPPAPVEAPSDAVAEADLDALTEALSDTPIPGIAPDVTPEPAAPLAEEILDDIAEAEPEDSQKEHYLEPAPMAEAEPFANPDRSAPPLRLEETEPLRLGETEPLLAAPAEEQDAPPVPEETVLPEPPEPEDAPQSIYDSIRRAGESIRRPETSAFTPQADADLPEPDLPEPALPTPDLPTPDLPQDPPAAYPMREEAYDSPDEPVDEARVAAETGFAPIDPGQADPAPIDPAQIDPKPAEPAPSEPVQTAPAEDAPINIFAAVSRHAQSLLNPGPAQTVEPGSEEAGSESVSAPSAPGPGPAAEPAVAPPEPATAPTQPEPAEQPASATVRADADNPVNIFAPPADQGPINIFAAPPSSQPPSSQPPSAEQAPEPAADQPAEGTRRDGLETRFRANAMMDAPGETALSAVASAASGAAASGGGEANSPADIARVAGAESVPELLTAAAAYLTLVKEQNQFTRREVMTVFDQLPGEHSRSLEARIKGYGKLVRNGQLVLVGDGLFALSQAERDRIGATLH